VTSLPYYLFPIYIMLVLVTGISGYLASYVAQEAFAAGHKVRGTVRNVSKADATRKLFDGKPLELVQVPDIAESDLAEAMKNVDVVLHVASPYHFKIDDPQKDMLDPAVKGTTNVLQQAHKAGIKRIVVTSSFAAVTNFKAGGPNRDYTYTDADWNPLTAEDACAPGAAGPIVYSTSKKLAEKAAWDFQQQHSEMEIVTMCPPMIYGPPIQACSKAEDLNTSSATIYNLINSPKTLPDDRLPLCCDVRDVAKAHVLSIDAIGVTNKRVLLWSGEAFVWDDAVRYLQEKRPELADRLAPVPADRPAKRRNLARLDTSLAQKELGLEFIPWQTTLLDTVDALLELEKQFK